MSLDPLRRLPAGVSYKMVSFINEQHSGALRSVIFFFNDPTEPWRASKRNYCDIFFIIFQFFGNIAKNKQNFYIFLFKYLKKKATAQNTRNAVVYTIFERIIKRL